MGFFGKKKEIDILLDLDLIENSYENVHMKNMALHTNIDLIARTISQLEFLVVKDGEYIKDRLYYKLNVKPNKNQNAYEFWKQFVENIFYENECLIIKTDSDDLVIADDFYREKSALYEDKFSNVQIDTFRYDRDFYSESVLYFHYSNRRLQSFVNGIYKDYGELFSRIVAFQKRKSQVRAVTKIDTTKYDQSKTHEIQEFINRLTKAFRDQEYANVPMQEGLEYSEANKNTVKAESVDEVAKVVNNFTNHIANCLGIPVGLLNGNLADVEKQTDNYMRFCINPLIKFIISEFNGKFFTEKEILNGDGLEANTTPLMIYNIFNSASSIDKLIASGMYTINELRLKLGDKLSTEELANRHHITKNYETLGGGEQGDKEES